MGEDLDQIVEDEADVEELESDRAENEDIEDKEAPEEAEICQAEKDLLSSRTK